MIKYEACELGCVIKNIYIFFYKECKGLCISSALFASQMQYYKVGVCPAPGKYTFVDGRTSF